MYHHNIDKKCNDYNVHNKYLQVDETDLMSVTVLLSNHNPSIQRQKLESNFCIIQNVSHLVMNRADCSSIL